MKHYPKISIVTPSFNQAEFLETTMKSVLDQNYPNLEYIVIDGGSSDDSVKIIKKYESKLAYWTSGKDQGLYFALAKGFELSTGTIMGWINSDDVLHTHSLFTIAEILEESDVMWVQGYPNVIDETGRIVYSRKPRWSKYEFYSGQFVDNVFIQQESTFWHRELWNKSGGYIDTGYKLAGDFELWLRFFAHADLYLTSSLLGSFRKRLTGQLSSDRYQEYIDECFKAVSQSIGRLSIETQNQIHKYNRCLAIQRRASPMIARFLKTQQKIRSITGFPKKIEYDFSSCKFQAQK